MTILWFMAIALADDGTCDTSRLDTPTSYLRALSLDLRGTIPSVDEYQLVIDGEDPEVLSEAWLTSPEFADRVVRLHHDLLWNNVTGQSLFSATASVTSQNSAGAYYSNLRRNVYRGGSGDCGSLEAQWNGNGELITNNAVDTNGRTVRQEGWVWVTPYWSATPIKVCAFEAQTAEVSTWGTRCDTSDGFSDPECGCGPDLRWCVSSGNTVTTAMGTEVDKRISTMILEDRPYLEMFTGKTMFVNGPLSYYLRYQTGIPGNVTFAQGMVDKDRLPNLAFTDTDTWVEVELGPEHAGVLTSPAYLVRFMTERARANRFYTSFLCQPFQPPSGGIEIDPNARQTLNLTERDGCKYCHALLEPSAAYWGRWTPGGGGYLDPEKFPTFDESCEWCALTGAACSAECKKYYVIDSLGPEQDPYIGWLNSAQYLADRHVDNIDEGPALLVSQTIQDGRLPACVARTAATRLFGRDLLPEEEPWLSEITEDFVANDWRYSTLVHEIVTSDTYRSVP